jgi:hypothetical protein
VAGKFHNLVVKALLELGENLTKSRKWKTRFREVFDGNKVPIKIVNPVTRRLIGWNYFPDVYYITKVERKFIFEVIDKESINEIIADYIQAVLCHAHAIIFIMPSEREAEVTDIVETIDSIFRYDLKIKKLPYKGYVPLYQGEYKDIKTVKRILNEYLEKYWYTPRPIKS